MCTMAIPIIIRTQNPSIQKPLAFTGLDAGYSTVMLHQSEKKCPCAYEVLQKSILVATVSEAKVKSSAGVVVL